MFSPDYVSWDFDELQLPVTQANVNRLKAYRSNVVIFPRNVNRKTKKASAKNLIAGCCCFRGFIFCIDIFLTSGV